MTVSKEQFIEIVEETKGIVLGAVRKYLFHHYAHAIDDVVQETYFRAYKSLTKNDFEDRAKLSTWLYTIAKNEAFRMNAKFKREEQKTDLFAVFAKTTPENDFKIDEKAVGVIMKNINLLPEKYRTIVMLFYDGESEAKIAETLLLPMGTVKSRLHRAKNLLSKQSIGGE